MPTQLPAVAEEVATSDPNQILQLEERNINTKAFLSTIAWAEGTGNSYGYQIMFTGVYFNSFWDHPRQVRCAYSWARRLCSSASGRYQFLETTWDRVALKLGLRDFSPASQDQAAVELIREQGALEDVEAGRWQTAIYKVAPVWASLPDYNTGQSVYGQPVKLIDQLGIVYAYSLNFYRQLALAEVTANRSLSAQEKLVLDFVPVPSVSPRLPFPSTDDPSFPRF
ncbi:glycoside hydrolase family 104 protein [Leptolyngbya sp. FACHB-261]|uniref:glycoside hydrolase family 24 protein n=1 Tax=Leptolyngbya sp. FACHB-261 TaxID=2692806 RepID=UPI001F54A0A3|nr:glycoside hydrolase family 104 protein [Leptolyngbya sp. FACHB-261]